MFKILLFVFIYFIPSINQTLFPKQVWLYWHQSIEKAPLFVRLCYEKILYQCKAQQWNLTLLNQQILPQYIPNYEERIQKVRRNSKSPYVQNFVDFIRIAIIEEHGGVYFDISVILFEGLSWLQNLQKTPYLITNKRQQSPQALFPYITFYQSSTQWRNDDGSSINQEAGYEDWFMAAKPRSQVMTDWRKAFELFYQNTVDDLQEVLKDQQIFMRTIERSNYLLANKAVYYFLQRKQFQLDKNLSIFSQRIFASEYYKLWGFKSQIGPYSFQFYELPQRFVNLFDKTIQQIKQQNINIRFFVKLLGYKRDYFEQMLNFQIQITSKGWNFQKFMANKPTYEQCSRKLFPVQGSVIGNLLENNILAQKLGLFQISKQQRTQWQEYCKDKQFQMTKNNSAIYNLFSQLQKTVFQNVLSRSVKSMARIEENRLYAEDLDFSEKIKIFLQVRFLKIIVFFGQIFLIFIVFLNSSSFISNLTLKFVKKIMLKSNYQQNKSTQIQINKNEKNYVTLLVQYLYVLLGLITLDQYTMYQLTGDIKLDDLLIFLVVSYILLNRKLKKQSTRISQRLILIGYSFDELRKVFDPLVFFFLGKMLLNWTQVRPDQIFSDSIIICLMLPYLFKSLKYTNLFRSNSLKKWLNTLQTVHYIALISFIFICRFSNLRHIIIGEKYLLTVIPPLLVYYTIFFLILRFLAGINEIIKQLKSLGVKSIIFLLKLVKQGIQLAGLVYIFYLSYTLRQNIVYLQSPFNRFIGSLMFMIFFIYSDFKLKDSLQNFIYYELPHFKQYISNVLEVIFLYITPIYLIYLMAYQKQKIMINYVNIVNIVLYLMGSTIGILIIFRYTQSLKKNIKQFEQLEKFTELDKLSFGEISDRIQ